ncbi:MAG: hypothetical protein COA67_06570 [Lutibacter sp.]|nr:MAG: hypothetical protein COA67_06570 [Lutibacter sp.]
MKTFLKFLVVLLTPSLLFSQNEIPTEAINGTYHLLEAERGVGNKQTQTKIFQYGLFGDTKVLAIAACGKCMPAIYTYKEAESKELGIHFFYNDIGLFVITYDNESFVMLKLSNKESVDFTDFSFSNFYSKNKTKVDAMTQQKIKEYILSI